MPRYRRIHQQGATYFFTVNLQDRTSSLLVDQVDLLRRAVRRTKELMPFHIDAWVVLPNHMHALWTLPGGDAAYPTRWHTIKAAFSRSLPTREVQSATQERRGERAVWQRRYWEHTIRDDRDYAAHVDYIHFNPVRHGLVAAAGDWPFSSYHRAVVDGLYPAGWAGGESIPEAGEP